MLSDLQGTEPLSTPITNLRLSRTLKSTLYLATWKGTDAARPK